MSMSGQTAPTQDAIALRAAEFFQRRRFWDWSEADQAELDAWLAQSDFHRVAYLRLESGAARLSDTVAFHAPKPEAPREMRAYKRFIVPLLAAASIALIAAAGIPYLRALLQPADRIFGTNVGGHALLGFADGTAIELNTNTALRYRMTNKERTVWLDRGEAYFRVAHDAKHPFAVIVGGHRITDLGTEFLVRADAGALDVALVQGRAQLASDNAVPVATLTPGDEAVATHASTIVTKKTAAELADETAWRRGVLVFRNTKLADAVKEFNRYNDTKLVIADPSIADLKFTAEVKTDNFEGFLQLAEITLNLRVDREGNDILIFRGSPEKTKRAARAKHGL